MSHALRFLLKLLLMLCAYPCFAAIAVVQVLTPGVLVSAGTLVSAPFTGLPVAGNRLKVGCIGSNAFPTYTVTDNQAGNSYSQVVAGGGIGSFLSAVLFDAVVVGSAGTFTLTCHSNLSESITIFAIEVSGESGSTDGTSNAGGSGPPANPGIIATTNAADIVVGLMSTGSFGPYPPASGFTLSGSHGDPGDGGGVYGAMEYRIVSSAGSYDATISYAGSAQFSAVAAAFRATSTNVRIKHKVIQ